MQAFPDTLVQTIIDECHPLHGTDADFLPLIEAIGDASIVLLGEASHGTHDFYEARASITRLLIEQCGFGAVAVEADWPDAYRVNRFVRGASEDPGAETSLGGFMRFPQWMWRNRDVVDFVAWLRRHNQAAGNSKNHCGFYGMDLYSLYSSMDAVLAYLDHVDPAGARRARFRYGCFEQFGEDPQAYGYAAGLQLNKSCEDQVIMQLVDLQRRAADLAKRDGHAPEDEYFFAEQNARLVKNAEAYYRQMFAGRVDTWNLRDTHMVETIDALRKHLDRTRRQRTKIVIWAHNSHLGDARATDMSRRGEVNVGQLCRQRRGDQVFNVGFTTHDGEVTAADDWGAPARHMAIVPSLSGSYERLFHETQQPRFLLVFREQPSVAGLLVEPLLERAIGVIYRPETERRSHYFQARLSAQFDAVIHFDRTAAVIPLEPMAPFELEKAETYPTGI